MTGQHDGDVVRAAAQDRQGETGSVKGKDTVRSESDVLVVGAGIAGMQASLLLAEMGFRVCLLDRAPAIGGLMPLLDRTFPTNTCGLCFMSPTLPALCPFIECSRHPLIELVPSAEVEGLEGEQGDFRVSILHKARYVDPELCTGCGECAAVCPVEVPRELGAGLETRRAIYRPYPQAFPPAFVVDRKACTECGECLKVCRPGAIDLKMEDQHSTLKVGAVILTPGFEPFDATLKTEFGYGVYKNVLTSIQFERMLSLTSPSQGLPTRPSDNQAPARIAFIQCVGSRDISCDRGYCSSVCCMYATKQAMLAKERLPEVDVSVFHMDVRTFGKDFERYYERAKEEYGIRYRRTMVSRVRERADDKSLTLSCVDDAGAPLEEEFDLVVLSVGFGPPLGGEGLAGAAGVPLNRYGFCVTKPFSAGKTQREGVFVAGAFREPQDIPQVVVEASAAAAGAAEVLADRRAPQAVKQYPEERDVSDEEARVGVFLCDCEGSISEALDIPALAEYTGGLLDVAHVAPVAAACGPEGLAEIASAIGKQGLNRVVVAGCTHRLYDDQFGDALRQARLNPCLLERADLREGCAWVHGDDPEEATHKAKQLVAMAVAKARLLTPSQGEEGEVSPGALVIGGGVAGLEAARSLARQGFFVHLVEKEKQLGGNLLHVHYTLDGGDPQQYLRELVDEVEGSELISLHLGAGLQEVAGEPGRYRTTISSDGQTEELVHGVIVVATGGQEVKPTEYLYGAHPQVVTQRELEERVARDDEALATVKNVVMIQCVGSREPARPYCSRICCSVAIKNALRLKESHPEARVFVLFRDMRTYGFQEDFYREAREKGVVFVRYDPEAKPRVEAVGERLRVVVTDPILGLELRLDADLVVLSVGVEPADNRAVAELLGVPLDQDGFFQEASTKVRPMDFEAVGMYLCGLCHAPKNIEESISQARGAAMRAAVMLAKQRLEGQPAIPFVNPRLCIACGQCIETCPYGALVADAELGITQVVPLLCQGCGACAVVCPSGAIQQRVFEKPQLMAMLDAALE
jgi:heterodisulfide reductase subunit A